MPNVVILAGPNGAGKTSAAPVLLRGEFRVREFVNADVIARGLSGFSPDAMAVEAGRLMLRRLEELAHAQQDFAFETTLSGIAFPSALERWRSAGYVVRIVYLWLASADVAVKRVHARVQQGGHTVPDDVVRRRYERGLANFATRYRVVADQWQLYDNTDALDRRLVAYGERGIISVVDDRRWSEFQQAVAAVSRIREVLMSERPPLPDDHLTRVFRDPAVIERAMRITHARVIRRHRLLNQPLVVWRDGVVQYLDPHTVPMPEGVTEEEMGPVFDYL
jgi:predicted ABC-type ATPase